MSPEGPASPDWLEPALAVLVPLVRRRTESAGPVLIGIDGRSGAGKTRLADALALRLRAPVVRLEDLYDGWRGLSSGVARWCAKVAEPLAAGRSARFRRYDWVLGRLDEEVEVPPSRVVVAEGVGTLAGPCRPRLAVGVWLEAPATERRSRALARDGEEYRPRWQDWAAQEEELFAPTRPWRHADVVIHTAQPRVSVSQLRG